MFLKKTFTEQEAKEHLALLPRLLDAFKLHTRNHITVEAMKQAHVDAVETHAASKQVVKDLGGKV